MKLGGERLGAQDSISKVFARCNEWLARLERHGGPFIAPKGIYPFRCQRSEHFMVGGQTCPANLSGNRPGDLICSIWGLSR
jgi:hypothetical protein